MTEAVSVVDVSETCTVKVYEGVEAALRLLAVATDTAPDDESIENVVESPPEKKGVCDTIYIII
jgi:hypothetical protein